MLVIDIRACFLIGLLCAVLSVTVSKSKICSALRSTFSRFNPWLGDLVSCPFCIGHWFSALFLLLYHPFAPGLRPFLLAFGITLTTSAIFSGIIIKLFESPHTSEDKS